jgi:hypothetical protein
VGGEVFVLSNISPGHYQPIMPTFIVGWHPDRLALRFEQFKKAA